MMLLSPVASSAVFRRAGSVSDRRLIQLLLPLGNFLGEESSHRLFRLPVHEPGEESIHEQEEFALQRQGHIRAAPFGCLQDSHGDLLARHAPQVIELQFRLLFQHVLREVRLRQTGADHDHINPILGQFRTDGLAEPSDCELAR